MQYRLTEQRANLVVRSVELWLKQESLDRIAVDAVQGSGSSRQQAQAAIYPREEIDELGTAEALVDLVVEEHGQRGGKLQLRAIFRDELGKESEKRKTLQLTRVGPGERTGSQGRDAGIERLASSMGTLVDGLGRRIEHSQDHVVQALKEQAGTGERFFEKMLELQGTASNTALTQAVTVEALKQSLEHERQLHELRIEMLEQESIWQDLAPQLVQLLPHVVGGLAPVLGSVAQYWNAKASAITAGLEQPGTSQGEPPPDAPAPAPEAPPESNPGTPDN